MAYITRVQQIRIPVKITSTTPETDSYIDMPLYDIDGNITEGVSYSINGWITEGHPREYPTNSVNHSLLAYNGVVTPCRTRDNSIIVSPSTAGQSPTVNIRVYDGSSLLFEQNSLISNFFWFPYIGGIIRGINGGVTYYGSTDVFLEHNNTSTVGTVYNTGIEFGIYKNQNLYLSGSRTPNAHQIKVAEILLNALEAPDTDPYNQGGNSSPGGGDGDFDISGDSIPIPTLPGINMADTGFLTLFSPTIQQIVNLSTYMWSSGFDINALKKLFTSPIDVIFGLSVLPVTIPTVGSREVIIGNIQTGLYMNLINTQFIEVDCGSITVNKFWGAYLDFSPYTKCEIYLPYIGTHTIDTDDIMGQQISIKYHIDILSGACIAYIQSGNAVLYQFTGQCGMNIPITGDSWVQTINGAINIATAFGSMVASGGATVTSALGVIGATASNVVNSEKPKIEKSGSISGTPGFMGVQTPYLIITRPRQALPVRQNEYTGYPSFITAVLGDLSGFTIIAECKLKNIPATDSEITEIENLLKKGVFL